MFISHGCGKNTNTDEILKNHNLNDFFQHFSSIHTSHGADLDAIIKRSNEYLTFNFREVSSNEVLKAFKNIKNIAVGFDGFSLNRRFSHIHS